MSSNFPIHLFEEHSSTLPVWWQNRSEPRTAVYLDAHLDLQMTSGAHIQALRACNTLDQIKMLEKPHHLNPSPRYAFGIENFLYSASQLKLIERLVWVVPPHIPREYSSALLEYIQQMDGISFNELTGFKPFGEGALRGTLLGLDITVCDYQHLHSLNVSTPYYLDIDIDYFVQVPEDRLWIDPAVVIHSLLEQLGDPVVATISRAVGSGFTPLSMRFVADYIAELLAGNIAGGKHYTQLVDALESITQGQPEQAIESCNRSIHSKADIAASYFIKSIAMELAGYTPETIEAERKHAIELEPCFAFDLSRAASGFPNRHRDINTEQLRALAAQLSELDPPESGIAEIAIALLCARTGNLKQAWQLLQKQKGELENHGELLLEIARGILNSSEPEKARALLELATKSRKTRTSANLYLGDLAYHTGKTRLALEYYQKAHGYAPAWMLPLERQAICLEAMDETIQRDKITDLIHSREQCLKKLTGPD